MGKRGHRWDIDRYPVCHHASAAPERVTQPPSPNGRTVAFLALVCGWFNLVAPSPIACQVGEQKRSGRGQNTGALRTLDAKSRGFDKYGANKNKQTVKTRAPTSEWPSFSGLPSPQATAGEGPEPADPSPAGMLPGKCSQEEFQTWKHREEAASSPSGRGDVAHETRCVR